MSDKSEFIINTLQGIWFDLQYLRDKVVIDPDIKQELRDNHIKVNEEECCGSYEIW